MSKEVNLFGKSAYMEGVQEIFLNTHLLREDSEETYTLLVDKESLFMCSQNKKWAIVNFNSPLMINTASKGVIRDKTPVDTITYNKKTLRHIMRNKSQEEKEEYSTKIRWKWRRQRQWWNIDEGVYHWRRGFNILEYKQRFMKGILFMFCRKEKVRIVG